MTGFPTKHKKSILVFYKTVKHFSKSKNDRLHDWIRSFSVGGGSCRPCFDSLFWFEVALAHAGRRRLDGLSATTDRLVVGVAVDAILGRIGDCRLCIVAPLRTTLGTVTRNVVVRAAGVDRTAEHETEPEVEDAQWDIDEPGLALKMSRPARRTRPLHLDHHAVVVVPVTTVAVAMIAAVVATTAVALPAHVTAVTPRVGGSGNENRRRQKNHGKNSHHRRCLLFLCRGTTPWLAVQVIWQLYY